MSSFVLNTQNLYSLGHVLRSLFRTKFPVFSDMEFYSLRDQSLAIRKIKEAISIVYKELGVIIDIDKEKRLSNITPREGDILVHEEKCYLVVRDFITSVSTVPEMKPEISKNYRSFTVIRPDLSNLNLSNLDNLKSTLFSNKELEALSKEEQTVDVSSHISESAIQIGDLVLLVDPSQISFTTQNGYQYYPTIRSAGNPQLPTLQQVKNFNIGLIFPNTSSINNQLIPLLAMYRRAPFVNIRNKDLLEFFPDLKALKTQFIPVALESIQVQSIEGFPNSVEANLTMLPLDIGPLNGGLKALRSMGDVKKQQYKLNENKDFTAQLLKSETNLRVENPYSAKFLDIHQNEVKSDPDFRKSIPFRAFYQSMILGRTRVLDETGAEVQQIGGEPFDITRFAPKDPANYYGVYTESGNKTSVSLVYSYIDQDYRQFAKEFDEKTRQEQLQRLKRLKEFSTFAQNFESFVDETFVVLHNSTQLFKLQSFSLTRLTNAIAIFSAQHGVDSPQVEVNIRNLWDYFIKGAFYNSALGDLKTVAGTVIKSAVPGGEELELNPSDDVLNINPNLEIVDQTGKTMTITKVLQNLWNWGNKSETNKSKLIKVLNSVAEWLLDETVIDDIVVDTDNPDQPFKIVKAKIKTETIEIDNSRDVIVGWNLVFANKLIPIMLAGHKYPIYQHIGSDDISVSLRIVSDDNKSNADNPSLKSRLAAVSDRIFNSTKVIMFSAPDLINYYDPRIAISTGPGHILKALGIKNVILNSSNTTNMQGNPNAWNTVINFSQSQLTLRQYHQIESESDNLELSTYISSLIPRLYFNERTGKLSILKFRKPAEQNGLVYEDITDYNELLSVSFLKSAHGLKLVEYVNTLNGKKVFSEKEKQQFLDQEQGLGKLVQVQIDTNGTAYLQKLQSEAPGVVDALKFIATKYDALLSLQADSLISLFEEDKNGFFDYLTEFNNIFGAKTGSELAIGIGSIGLLALIALTPVGWVATGATVALAVGSTTAVVAPLASLFAKAGIRKIKNDLSAAIVSTGEAIKSQLIVSFSQSIMKDPIIRDSILSPNLFGEDILTNIKNGVKDTSKSCYPDFDIPTKIALPKEELFLTPDVYLSPDFYLANDIITKAEITNYVDEAMGRLVGNLEMYNELGFLEYDDILTRFDEIWNNNTIPKEKLSNIKNEIGYTGDLTTDLAVIYQTYREKILKLELPKNIDEQVDALTSKIDETFADLKVKNPKEFEKKKALYIAGIRSNMKLPANLDASKFNLLYTAKWKTIIEILELYTSILQWYSNNGFLKGEKITFPKLITRNITKIPLLTDGKGTVPGENLEALNGIQEVIELILDAYSTGNSQALAEKLNKTVNQYNYKGMFAPELKNKDQFIQMEHIKQLQNLFYNKVNDLQRLTEVEIVSKSTGTAPTFSDVPDYRFLDFFTQRDKEDIVRRFSLIQQLTSSLNDGSKTTIRLFPTFKLYFIEEDRNIFRELNTYYSYNAIQSIEISKNKESSSFVARIVLSNLTNTLTDKLTFAREPKDNVFSRNTKNDNAFFGTLDIKPGTQIMIKMGYSASDQQLDTVFHGRILEMTVGPTTEIICQSFGAQLNHEIQAHSFGLWGTSKEFGDVATAVLDLVPGLEKLGKTDTFNLQVNDFTLRNTKNYRGNIVNRFLMSNIFGSVAGSLFGQSNPRDENIYLDYQLTDKFLYKPTFDWRVFDQTVWSVMKELALFNQNTVALMRPYNRDLLSSKGESRETLFIGNKSGYYKHTDSFSLSSLNFDKVKKSVANFNELKNLFKVQWDKDPNYIWNDVVTQRNQNQSSVPILFNTLNIKYMKLSLYSSSVVSLYKFLQDPQNSTVLVQYLLEQTDVSDVLQLGERIKKTIDDLLRTGIQEKNSLMITNLTLLAKYDPIPDPENYVFDLSKTSDYDRFTAFSLILKHCAKSSLADADISPEKFANSKVLTKNTDDSLLFDPRYKKVQQHHLVSDLTDIISNNISLSSSFYNAINVYYLPEPEFVSEQTLGANQIKKLNVWTIKAFGDTRDEHTRIKNSFQKNIDTNWWDIRKSVNEFYEGYNRMYVNPKDNSVKAGTIDDIQTALQSIDSKKKFNPQVPDWRAFPSFVTVAINLLKSEVSKMYQGTIDIIGNPKIEPGDILHIQDWLNNMHGAVEVEEVIHTFTPDRGFRTTLVPNLLVYDRDPVQLQDVEMISKIYNFTQTSKLIKGVGTGVEILGGAAIAFAIGGPIGLALFAVPAAFMLWNGIENVFKRPTKYLYATMGKILGRDCINFTTLTYHNMPLIAGFEGVDYTSLPTLMNHAVENQTGFISRLTTWSDPAGFALWTGFQFNSDKFGPWTSFIGNVPILNHLTNSLPQPDGLTTWGVE